MTTYAYISKIITFAIMPFNGNHAALTPHRRYNFGAGKPERIRKTIRFCTAASLLYALVLLLIMEPRRVPSSAYSLITES